MPSYYPVSSSSRPSSSSSNDSSRSRPSGGPPKHSTSRRPRILRRLDNLFCSCITYFPLAIVYGATAWAVWVEAYSISWSSIGGARGHFLAFLGILFYWMLNWSYTVATFSSPGTPLEQKSKYSSLPTHSSSSITVKASGEERFCKKCQCRKPDRTHHCSTCNTCVLKMDHHCPWLANCLGITNYKPFVLFTFYLAVFCLYCCLISSVWIWEVIFKDARFAEQYMPINWILLAVISGVVGIVVTGFSGYHFYLVFKGETTIESMEKTRYLTPLRKKNNIPWGANLLGGGAGNGVMGPSALEMRERERYNEYLIEETSREMPNAFDLGWKTNFVQVFGTQPVLWFVPVRNSVGDGWVWETSQRWKDAQRELQDRKRREAAADQERMRRAGWGGDEIEESNSGTANGYAGSGATPWTRQAITGLPSPGEMLGSSKAARILGAREEEFSHGLGGSRYSPNTALNSKEMNMRMQDLKKKSKKVVMSRDELSDEDDEDIDYDTTSEGEAGFGVNGKRKNGESSKSAGGVSSANSLNRKEVDNWSEGW
ncbi:palmitoyltransferase for Vac8p [Orbilia blumenaviensis]|uniref:Palmitoyltransferase n=1 Tax=Orbilia blumenaviensis TaxID=1796055 RepID=A0AAV9VHL4_9PEZI